MKADNVFNRHFGSHAVAKEKLVREGGKWETQELPKPKRVIIIGKRTLCNGHFYNDYDPESGDHSTEFVPDEYFTALLVVENMHRRPFFIRCPSYLLPK